jgi:hypothetical protein
MTSFIRGEFEGNGQPWSDDPAKTLVDELEHELSEELEAEGPEFTPVRRHGESIGRLVDEDGGGLDDTTREALARETYDDSDLSAEESALHYVDEEGESEDPDLSPAVRAELENF